MITICRSNRLTHLGDQIAHRLREGRGGDPFVPDTVIVPNLDTSGWLKIHLAEKNGFAGNIRFMLPAEWMWSSIREWIPDVPEELPSDPGPMKWTLFSLLKDETQRKQFPLLDRFIRRQPSETQDEALLQLSGRLASLYDKYLVYRPEMVLRWQKGQTGSGDEKWQAELWNLMNSRWKDIHTGAAAMNRADLYSMLLEKSETGQIQNKSTLHLFNPGLIPPPVAKLIGTQGKERDITLYLISPSRQPGSHPLIDLLGDEQESIRTLYSFRKAEQEDFFEPAKQGKKSNIEKIRESLLDADDKPELAVHQNTIPGIEIRSCHSPLREIEVLHDYLLGLFNNNQELAPDDVLVVTPDLQKYLPSIHAVFGNPEQGLPAIPYHAAGNKPVLMDQAVQHLLSLPGSRFAFDDVMDFFQMEPVREKFGLSETEAAYVKDWMRQNHVFWAIDDDHRREWNQPDGSLQTWSAAIKRGWLGQMIATGPGEFYRDTLLFPGITTSDEREWWAAFADFLDQLNTMRLEAGGIKSADEWCRLVSAWCDRFFDARQLMNYNSSGTSSLAEDLARSISLSGIEEKLPFRLIMSELSDQLKSGGAGRARLHRGVTFSNMVPVRSLPFKAVALIGLNEGVFPRKESLPEFDLMLQNPETTDRNHRNEDKNLFLESILSAGEYHYCSYIGQSAVDNEPLPPSPVLAGWASYLSGLTGLSTDQIIQKEAISSFSLNNYRAGHSFSQTGYSSAQAIRGESDKTPFVFSKESEEEPAGELVPAEKFCSFFSNPVRAFVRSRLDARLTDISDEPDEFTLNSFEKHLLYEKVFLWMTEGKTGDEIQSLLLGSGLMPAGWPGEKEAEELVSSVANSIGLIEQLGVTPELRRFSVQAEISGLQIGGEITSYSASSFLDLSFSSGSGSLYLQSWIRHLLLHVSDTAETGKSHLICGLKKNEPKIFRFRVPDEPALLLEKLTKLYLEGLEKPLPFFPKTVYEYAENIEKGEDHALNKAAEAFEGGFKRYAERDDLNISFLMGPDTEFTEQMVSEPFLGVIETMMQHMQEVAE
jgi:exodeoxyribonuclease V gamma subunit